MNWLNAIVDDLVKLHPDEEVIVSSGVSPSGTYHLGTLREVLTAEVIMRELKRRGHKARHIHVVDDLDVLRKIPADVPKDFEKHLGKPLTDVPSPDGSDQSYADYFLGDLLEAAKGLRLEMEIIRAHEKYRSGFFVPAIEKALGNIDTIRKILEDISGRKMDGQWSPVQVIEDSYLKNRKFISIDPSKKELTYADVDGKAQTIGYSDGNVKLNWRIDWPARWWLLGVNAEPFGRDHATKGGSYDTGAAIAKVVFDAEPPIPVPYNFINRTGNTKKMSKSAGDTVTATDLLKILPPEVVWFFMLRYGPEKLLFFDDGETLMRLFDEFSEMLSKPDKSLADKQLLELSLTGVGHQTVSRIPFSHLVASYQAALKDPAKTLEVMRRTEHAKTVDEDEAIIRAELKYIDEWLKRCAPEDVKFELVGKLDKAQFTDTQKKYLELLSDKVANAPKNADGEWFHKAIYDLKDHVDLDPKELFVTLYLALLGKEAGPRAGWFLSLLPRDWLVSRLRLQA